MAKILITTLPHEGHLNPTFGIASELRQRGHTISYLGHPLINGKIREQDFPILENRKMGPADIGFFINLLLLQKSQGEREMKLAMKLFTSRLKPQVRHISKLLKSYQPDILINDAFHYATALAAEKHDLPWVDCWTAGMMHPDSEPYLAPVAKESLHKLLGYFDARINRVRDGMGLEKNTAGSFLKPSKWLQLYTTCLEVEPHIANLGSTAACIGPCIGDRQETPIDIDELFSDSDKSYPLVYVSFGTFFNRNKKSIRKLIESAEKLKIRMLISTPLVNSKHQFKLPNNNVVLLERVPQRQVLNQTQIFITHGGNNSVQEALSAGVPMLVTPIAGEQQYNAKRVRWLGAGEIIDVNLDSTVEITNKIKLLLNNSIFSKRASVIQEKLKKYNAPEQAADLIENIISIKHSC